jgi:hypothetical protein
MSRKKTLEAGARMLDDGELDRLWRLALQGEIEPAIEKLSVGGPKSIPEGKGTPWRRSSEFLFGRESYEREEESS